jgi:hypothetical protein
MKESFIFPDKRYFPTKDKEGISETPNWELDIVVIKITSFIVVHDFTEYNLSGIFRMRYTTGAKTGRREQDHVIKS